MKLLVLSDLHLGHRSSRAERALLPLSRLAKQFDRVIVGGDAIESCGPEAVSSTASDWLARLNEALCAGKDGPLYLTGNHDPEISGDHYAYFEEPGLLAFHGDLVLQRSAPWIAQERILEERVQQALDRCEAKPGFDERVGLFRRTQIQYLRDYPLDLAHSGPLRYVGGHFFPPTRIFSVLHYWWKCPDRAAAFASDFEKPVKHVVFGHSHRAGHWRRKGFGLYNTGSFMPLSRPHAVVVNGARVEFTPLAEML
jgi:UDP-2,3-diacylglucosamine pyrophosphatase LpxH